MICSCIVEIDAVVSDVVVFNMFVFARVVCDVADAVNDHMVFKCNKGIIEEK